MTLDKHAEYVRLGKDPWKEEFNLVAKAIDKVMESKNLTIEEKLYDIANIADSMNGRPHPVLRKKVNYKQPEFKLEF